jgi:hypothetical protein
MIESGSAAIVAQIRPDPKSGGLLRIQPIYELKPLLATPNPRPRR